MRHMIEPLFCVLQLVGKHVLCFLTSSKIWFWSDTNSSVVQKQESLMLGAGCDSLMSENEHRAF